MRRAELLRTTRTNATRMYSSDTYRRVNALTHPGLRRTHPIECSVGPCVKPRPVQQHQFGPLQAALDRKLVVSERATPVAVVQYRRLAGALHRLQIERGLKTLMVTSARPNEGKTLTVANLALTFSEFLSRRVLLIDGDLRQPSIHTLLRLPNASGLSDVLLSELDDIPLLQVTATLSVLPAGRPDSNAMAALASDRMEDLVAQFAAQFDWILLDAAPVESHAGAAVARADGWRGSIRDWSRVHTIRGRGCSNRCTWSGMCRRHRAEPRGRR